MNLKSVYTYMVVFLVLLFVLTGCGGSDSSDRKNTNGATSFIEQNGSIDGNETTSTVEQNSSINDENNSTTVVENNLTKTKGYLIDSPLQGVSYICDGNENLTNEDGMFECVDMPVTFKIGNLTIGTITALKSDKKVYPQDLLGLDRNNFSSPKLKRLARFLQSLDDDGVISKSIKIEQSVRDSFEVEQKFEDMKESEVQSLLSGLKKSFIEECGALKHLGDKSVNCNSNGSYYVDMDVADDNGEEVVPTPDTTKPVITLNGASTIELTQGTAYTELGATATDDRDRTVAVTTSGTVDVNVVGSYTITYKAKDNAGNEAIVTRTVNIVLPPDTIKPVITLNGASIIELTQGSTYTELGATATDDRDGTVAVTTSGTVDVNVIASYTITYKAKDSAGNEATLTRIVKVIPKPNDAPVASEQNVSIDEDTTDNKIILAGTDSDGNPLTYAIVTQPLHGTVTLSGAVAKYTPIANYNGTDSFTFKVNDGMVDSIEATVSIRINRLNDIPVATTQNVTTDEDSNKSIILTGSDIDGDILTYIITQQPSHGILNGTAPNITYAPNVDFNGSDSFKFKVNDGMIDSTEATVSITINSVNDAPLATAEEAIVDEDTIDNEITLVGTDVDGDTLTYAIVTQPSHGVVVLSGAVAKYTPTANYDGVDSFTFKVNDGSVDSAPATMTIIVTDVPEPNHTPIAIEQNVTVDEDTSNNEITLSGTDEDGDSLTYAIVTQSVHGTVTLTGAVAKYTPTADYNGTDSFTFKVNDGTVDSTEATVSITINNINDVPVATEQNVTIDEDTTDNEITLVGTDVDGDTLTYAIVTQPSHGVVVLNGAVAKYTPPVNYNGTDSFTFKVNDGRVDSIEANVSITINSVNDAPVALDVNISIDSDSENNITLIGTDIDSSTLSYSVTQEPTHGSVIINGNLATYTLNDGYSGSDSFKYKVNDGTLDSNEATVSIEITGDIHITEEYKVIPLGNNATINKKVYLDSEAKNLYLVLSNKNATNISTATVSHNVKVVPKSNQQSLILSSTKKIDIKHAPSYITDFNNNAKNSFINNNHRNANIVATPKTALVVGDSHTFYLSGDTTSSTEATLKVLVNNVNTNMGTRTLNVWVSDDSFGSGCSKNTCVTQDMVDALADKFLKSGDNNDIYDWVTNIYGKEWDSDANAKYSVLIGQTDTIDILLTDIDNDNSENGGVVGYFWAKDNFSSSVYSGSNERIMFYADSVMFANTSNGDFWQKELYATLAHEFQHMINFYQKNITYSSGTYTWLNEMMSVSIEDLLTTKLEHNGDRGVDYTDGSAGDSGNIDGRFPRFNENNDITLSNWGGSDNILNDYSKVASFSAFLTRNYGGAELMHNIMDNNFSDENAVIDAIKKTTGQDITFVELLQDWGVAVVLSSKDNLNSDTPQYNFGDFLITTYNGTSYDLGSINFFNYNPEPLFHTTISSVKPHANYYYEIGENITSDFVDLNVTLDENTTASLIVK